MTDDVVDVELCEIVSSVLGRPVNLETSRSDTPEWDSLKHMEIIFCVEGKWDVSFTEDEMVAITSLRDLKNKLIKINEA
jgi:acyl carrier protein